MPYDATMNTVTSTSAEAYVAYAAPGDFAGGIHIFRCHEQNLFCFRRFIMEPVEAGRANFVDSATAKVQIRKVEIR